ncbi:hypothetical protein AZA_00360 [Nitrospirillum viridazoti Y2]|nr:hypothetical protein AZA_00360 [Nitrospirillum amazonense Y2]
MAGHRQRARRLAVVARHRHVAGQGQAGPGVADRVARYVDGVAQADGTRREGQVAQAVADGAAREAAHRAIGTTHDHQVIGAGVDHVADDRTAVGQGPQAAGAGDQHRRGGVDRAGVAQGAQRATDIVAEQRQQQVGGGPVGAHAQRGAEARGRRAEAAGGQGPAHLGDGVALAGDQVAARQRRHRHGAAGEGGVAADQQLTRRAAADAHGQRARRLAVVTRHADGVGQQHVGAAVHQRATADVHLVVQHQVAAGQFHIRQRAGDRADATGTSQRTHGAAAAAGEHQDIGAGVHDAARDGAAVGDGADAALVVQGDDAGNGAAVGNGADDAGDAVMQALARDGVGGADDAAVVDAGDGAAVVQPVGHAADGALVDQGADAGSDGIVEAGGVDILLVLKQAGVDDRADGALVEQADDAAGRAAVADQADGALVIDAVALTLQQATVGQRAQAARAGDVGRRDHPADGAGVVQAGERAADVVVHRRQHQIDVGPDGGDAGADGQAGDAGIDAHTGIAGPRAALHQDDAG